MARRWSNRPPSVNPLVEIFIHLGGLVLMTDSYLLQYCLLPSASDATLVINPR